MYTKNNWNIFLIDVCIHIEIVDYLVQTCISNICTSVGVFVPMSEDTDWKPCKQMQYLHVSLFLYTICNTCTIPEMNWQYGAYLLTNPYIKLFHGVPLTLF